ncbi:uncharacterized protein LOC118191882 isoform X2 [Stegodyphus dumicola]|uniref:uncharacterized protein LOC118191882 isoform X2 n=1 Tax=Stegodyphus dumicola TaxID=202533 RepID=UPI0015AB0D4E|nr:uncharacterized protein LOC118191882 isoform X2 [Stegodyphus dumicola]
MKNENLNGNRNSIWLRLRSLEKALALKILKFRICLEKWESFLRSADFWTLTWIWTGLQMTICSLRTSKCQQNDCTRQQPLTWYSGSDCRTNGSDFESLKKEDGILLCALVEKLCMGACPRFDLLDPDEKQKNLKFALYLVEKHLGVKPEVSAEEISKGGKQAENKMLLLIAQIKMAFEKSNPVPIRPAYLKTVNFLTLLSEDKTYVAKGLGLLFAVKGQRACFNIMMDSTDNLDMVIEICGPNHTVCSKRFKNDPLPCRSDSLEDFADIEDPSIQREILKKKIPLEYEILEKKISVEYIPIVNGIHTIRVICGGQHIRGSPYIIKVENSDDMPLTELSHPKNKPGSWKLCDSPCCDEPTEYPNSKTRSDNKRSFKRKKILRYIVVEDGKEHTAENLDELRKVVSSLHNIKNKDDTGLLKDFSKFESEKRNLEQKVKTSAVINGGEKIALDEVTKNSRKEHKDERCDDITSSMNQQYIKKTQNSERLVESKIKKENDILVSESNFERQRRSSNEINDFNKSITTEYSNDSEKFVTHLGIQEAVPQRKVSEITDTKVDSLRMKNNQRTDANILSKETHFNCLPKIEQKCENAVTEENFALLTSSEHADDKNTKHSLSNGFDDVNEIISSACTDSSLDFTSVTNGAKNSTTGIKLSNVDSNRDKYYYITDSSKIPFSTPRNDNIEIFDKCRSDQHINLHENLTAKNENSTSKIEPSHIIMGNMKRDIDLKLENSKLSKLACSKEDIKNDECTSLYHLQHSYESSIFPHQSKENIQANLSRFECDHNLSFYIDHEGVTDDITAPSGINFEHENFAGESLMMKSSNCRKEDTQNFESFSNDSFDDRNNRSQSNSFVDVSLCKGFSSHKTDPLCLFNVKNDEISNDDDTISPDIEIPELFIGDFETKENINGGEIKEIKKRLSRSGKDVLPSIRESSMEDLIDFDGTETENVIQQDTKNTNLSSVESRLADPNENLNDSDADNTQFIDIPKENAVSQVLPSLNDSFQRSKSREEFETETKIYHLEDYSIPITNGFSTNLYSASPYKNKDRTETQTEHIKDKNNNSALRPLSELSSYRMDNNEENNLNVKCIKKTKDSSQTDFNYGSLNSKPPPNSSQIEVANISSSSLSFDEDVNALSEGTPSMTSSYFATEYYSQFKQNERIIAADEAPKKTETVDCSMSTGNKFHCKDWKERQCLSVKKVIEIFQKDREEPVDKWPAVDQYKKSTCKSRRQLIGNLLVGDKKYEDKRMVELDTLVTSWNVNKRQDRNACFSIKGRVELFERKIFRSSSVDEGRNSSVLPFRNKKNYYKKFSI